jgi:hypothetical protein
VRVGAAVVRGFVGGAVRGVVVRAALLVVGRGEADAAEVVEADGDVVEAAAAVGEAAEPGSPPQDARSRAASDTESAATGAVLRRDVMGPHRARRPRSGQMRPGCGREADAL